MLNIVLSCGHISRHILKIAISIFYASLNNKKTIFKIKISPKVCPNDRTDAKMIHLSKDLSNALLNYSIGVLTDLVFDPFLIHFSFVFVDIDHQKWSQKWTEKWDLWTWPPWNFQKWDQKWVKNGTTRFSAPWQPWTPQLVADSALSYHFPNIICQHQIFLESSLTIL